VTRRPDLLGSLDALLTPSYGRGLLVSDAPSITDTLTYPILTNETSPHFAEVLPVTVFGAMKSVIGSEEVRQAFRWLATRFSNCTDYRFELVAAGASGNLAYTLGYEHVSFSMDGGPVAPLTLRHPRLPPRRRRVEDRPPPRRLPPINQTPPADASTE
jgi:hypothetical protein